MYKLTQNWKRVNKKEKIEVVKNIVSEVNRQIIIIAVLCSWEMRKVIYEKLVLLFAFCSCPNLKQTRKWNDIDKMN